MPGRVGLYRDAPKPATLIETVDDESPPDEAGMIGDESDALDGTVIIGDGSVLATVSDGAGVGLLAELQPGLARRNSKAKAWMPTTTPATLRIFMLRDFGWLDG